MAFRTMRAELMNCPVNYEDPPEVQDEVRRRTMTQKLGQMGSSSKTVTWKRVLATPFKTPQECVGKSGSSSKVQKTDRLLGRTVHPEGHVRLLRRQTKSTQRGRE
jgi:hypothetical protein